MHKVCKRCTTQCAVDAARCPHCGHTEWWTPLEYEEMQMAKVTRHGGLTDRATGVGFSDDPDDERAAGTKVGQRTGEEAQVDGPLDEHDSDDPREPGESPHVPGAIDGHEGHRTLAGWDEAERREHEGGENAPGSESDAPVPPGPEVGEQDGEQLDYDSFTKGELIAEAEGRTPPVDASGTKAEIVARLRADDERQPGDQPA